MFEFGWDDRKAATNIAKHKVSFGEGSSVFMDSPAMTYPDDVDPLDRKFSLKGLSGKAVRGKYYARVMKGTNLVRLAPEVARLFPNDAAVNKALLSLAEMSKNLPDMTTRPKRGARKRAAV